MTPIKTVMTGGWCNWHCFTHLKDSFENCCSNWTTTKHSKHMKDANMFGEYSCHILIHRSRFFFQSGRPFCCKNPWGFSHFSPISRGFSTSSGMVHVQYVPRFFPLKPPFPPSTSIHGFSLRPKNPKRTIGRAPAPST